IPLHRARPRVHREMPDVACWTHRSHRPRPSLGERSHACARRGPAVLSGVTDPRRVALVLGIVIAILGLLGAVRAWAPGHGLEFFDLDGERNAPATFSALLLFTASFLTLRLPGSVVARPVSLVLAALFLYAGLDEAFEIHEKLEAKIDIDWELLYVPGFLVAVVA